MLVQPRSKYRFTAAVLAAGGLFVFTAPGIAEPVRHGALVIDHVWARATAAKAKNGAAYLMIKNTGAGADTLAGASGPVATKTGLHESRMDGAIMRMRQVKGGVAVPAGKVVMFKPGGYHIMLMGLKHPLKAGDSFPLTLKFDKAGPVTVTAIVRKVGPAMGSAGHTMPDGKMKMPANKAN